LALSVRAHRDGSNGTILEFASLRLFCRVSSRAFRTRSGLATHGVVRDGVWLYLYVLIETVPTVPSSSSPASAFSAGSQVGRSEPGPGWRLTGLYETVFGSICTCSSRRFQRYHPRVRQPPPFLPGLKSGVQNQVRAGDSQCARRPSSARSLRARPHRLNGAMYEFGCCRVP